MSGDRGTLENPIDELLETGVSIEFDTTAMFLLNQFNTKGREPITPLFGGKGLLICDGGIMHELLVGNTESLSKGSINQLFSLIIPGGLPIVDGDKWAVQRSTLASFFTPKNVDSAVFPMVKDIFSQTFRDLENYINDKLKTQDTVEINIMEVIESLTRRVISNMLFSADISKEDFNLINDLPKRHQIGIGLRSFASPLYFTLGLPLAIKNSRELNKVNDFVDRLINERIELINMQDINVPSDVLTAMINSMNNDEIDHITLRSTMLFLIFAGSDTTEFSLGSIFYRLLIDSENLSLVNQEIGAIADLNPNTLKQNFSRAGLIIEDVMNRLPPASFMLRQTGNDITLSNGTYIKKGTHLVFSQLISHNAFSGGRDPERYLVRPFSRLAKEENHFPYGLGSRTCLGPEVATIEQKLFIDHTNHLLRSFSTGIKHNPTVQYGIAGGTMSDLIVSFGIK